MKDEPNDKKTAPITPQTSEKVKPATQPKVRSEPHTRQDKWRGMEEERFSRPD
jgi:hypothetical protein